MGRYEVTFADYDRFADAPGTLTLKPGPVMRAGAGAGARDR